MNEYEKISCEYHNRLGKTIEDAHEQGLDYEDIMEGLISQCQIEACLRFNTYQEALGYCVYNLTACFQEMFEDIHSEKSELEKQKNQKRNDEL
jgi:hypothetical protein